MAERSELLKRRLNRLTRLFKGVEKDDIASVHRARIASRRLREFLPMLELSRGRARKLKRRLRKITTRLGSVRELDVLLLLIDELHHARRPHRTALSHIAVAVSKERDESRRHGPRRLPKNHVRWVARRLQRVVKGLRDGEEHDSARATRAWRWAVDARVVRRASRLQEAMENAGAVYLPDRLHTVRLSVKKLRYALELSTEAAGHASSADLRTLRRVQDLLGRLNDIEMLIDRARRDQASISPPNLAVWSGLDALIVTLGDDCRRLHARYRHEAPELAAMAERLSGARKKPLQGVASKRRAG